MEPMFNTLVIIFLTISSISCVLIAAFAALAGMQAQSLQKRLNNVDRQRKEYLEIEIYKKEKAALAMKAFNLMLVQLLGWESGIVI